MRLYFHLVSSQGMIRDEEGVEVDDASQAWVEAQRAIEEMRQAGEAEDWSGWTLDITDAAGRVVLSIDLGGGPVGDG